MKRIKRLPGGRSYRGPDRIFDDVGYIDLIANATLHPRVLHLHQEKLGDRY